MNPIFLYNAALMLGIALVGAGVDTTYGRGPCLTVVGALILAVTIIGAIASGRR